MCFNAVYNKACRNTCRFCNKKMLLKCTRNKDNSFHIGNLHLFFFKKCFGILSWIFSSADDTTAELVKQIFETVKSEIDVGNYSNAIIKIKILSISIIFKSYDNIDCDFERWSDKIKPCILSICPSIKFAIASSFLFI